MLILSSEKYMKNSGFVRVLSAAAACSMLFSLTACNDKKVLDSTKVEKKVVMNVGELDVPLEIYRYVALNYKSSYEAGKTQDIWLGDDGAALLSEIKSAISDTIVRMYATPAMCIEYGIGIDDTYITDSLDIKMDAIYEEFDNDYEAYVEEIKRYNMNDSVYRFLVREDLLADELLYKMIERGEIPTDTDQLSEIIDSDDFIRVKQILVASDNGKTPEENLRRAEELLEMANSGDDFDTLVQNYGEDLFMFNNPDGYYFARGCMHESFEDAAFELEVGEISGIVETNAGYSIIKRYEKDQKYIDDNFEELCTSYIDGLYNMAVEKFAETLTAVPTEELDNYSIFTLPDIGE